MARSRKVRVLDLARLHRTLLRAGGTHTVRSIREMWPEFTRVPLAEDLAALVKMGALVRVDRPNNHNGRFGMNIYSARPNSELTKLLYDAEHPEPPAPKRKGGKFTDWDEMREKYPGIESGEEPNISNIWELIKKGPITRGRINTYFDAWEDYARRSRVTDALRRLVTQTWVVCSEERDIYARVYRVNGIYAKG